jgi:thioredoxin reductase
MSFRMRDRAWTPTGTYREYRRTIPNRKGLEPRMRTTTIVRMENFDVVVCGGGPAGLSAALWLGRYRRKTLVVDAGNQRNLTATASHGYLTFDACSPAEFLERAHADVDAYPEITRIEGSVIEVNRMDGRFTIVTNDGSYRASRLVIATGVDDARPKVRGFDRFYGKHVFHCSCCDGYETRDLDVLAIGWGEHTAGYALDLLEWGARVTLVTNGNTFEGDEQHRAALERHSIELIEDDVVELTGDEDALTGAILGSGREVPAQRAFFSIAHEPRSELARSLGCKIDELGYVTVGPHGETTVEHVYAAGDITPGEQLVAVASAEGVIAGIACALSLRGSSTAPGAPEPGPDPEAELAVE